MLSILTRALLMAAGGGPKLPELMAVSKSTLSGFSASLTIDKPAGTQAGEYLLGIMSGQGANTWTGDTGWNEIFDHGTTAPLRLAWLLAGGSEPSSYTFTHSASLPLVGMILRFRNAVYDTIGTVVRTTGNGDLDMPQITAAGGALIAAAASQNGPSRTHSVPTGMELVDDVRNGNSFLSVFMEMIAPGATGIRTSTMAGFSTGANAGILTGVKSS